jgi:hypothetical protein
MRMLEFEPVLFHRILPVTVAMPLKLVSASKRAIEFEASPESVPWSCQYTAEVALRDVIG